MTSVVPLQVVVIGGGIAGLAAAHRVHQLDASAQITIIERDERLGGKLALAEVGGVQVDTGAEAVLNLRPEAVELARASGLEDSLVYPATTAANVWSRGVVQPMPRTMMGVPHDLRAIRGVISTKGVARAAMEARMPPMLLEPGDDLSVGALIEDRFGKEVVDRLVEPLLGGVYAGHARELSVRATVPQLAMALDGSSTLTQIASRAMSRPSGEVPIFAGLRGGMGEMPGAVAQASGAHVILNTTVEELARNGDGWQVRLPSDHEPLHADAVIIATQARPAASLLAAVAPRAAHELDRIDYASMAVLTLAFPTRDLPKIVGSGFLTPPVEGRQVKAATFSFNKWQWVKDAGQAQGLSIMRASIGRFREEHMLNATDEELLQRALSDLADAVGISVKPTAWHVQRWVDGLPQYAVGHVERVASIRREVAALPGIAVCGAAYDGVGIAACVASGTTAATKVLGELSGGADSKS
jgi:oxygen-dependent protoporphyrinogen oxidase